MKYLSFILALFFLISCGSDSFPKRYVNNDLASYDSKVFVWIDNGPAEEINLSQVSFSDQLNNQYFEEVYLEELRSSATIVEEFTLEDEVSYNMKETIEGTLMDTSGSYTESSDNLVFDQYSETNFLRDPDKDSYSLCTQLIAFASGGSIPVLDVKICSADSFDAILQAEKDRFDYEENDTIVIFLPTIEYKRDN